MPSAEEEHEHTLVQSIVTCSRTSAAKLHDAAQVPRSVGPGEGRHLRSDAKPRITSPLVSLVSSPLAGIFSAERPVATPDAPKGGLGQHWDPNVGRTLHPHVALHEPATDDIRHTGAIPCRQRDVHTIVGYDPGVPLGLSGACGACVMLLLNSPAHPRGM